MLEMLLNYGILALGVLMLGAGLLLRKGAAGKKKAWANILTAAGAWCLAEKILQLVFGNVPSEEFEVSIWAERVSIGGFELSYTVITTWCVMAVITVLALMIRLFVVPRLSNEPRGIQNVLEIIIENICSFTKSGVGDLGKGLPAYIFSVAVLMVGCAAVELLGVRAPTADITMTFAMALVTFLLINFYGIREKGVGGRISSMARPTPVVFPIKVVSDLAVPVSLACRLFGNMLGGMIVMDLLYTALGNAAIGFPSVLGLYFNLFHPLIQTYIFVTLTLTFIGEAVE